MSDKLREPRPLTGRKVLMMVLGFFGTVIAVNIVMMVLAIGTLPGTEVDSTYSASLAYERDIQAAQRQETRHWNVTASARRDGEGDVAVDVEARKPGGEPIVGLALNVRLQRPVDKKFDRGVLLSEKGGGAYRGTVRDVAAGQWDLLIDADADGKPVFQSKSRIVFN